MKFPKIIDKTRILLINDDKLIQKSLYELLSRYGYKIDIAASEEEALNYLDKSSYHIILVDINNADDIEILTTLKEKSSFSSIIILASYGNLEAAVKSIRMGAFDYLVRPIEDEKIISTIEKVLANKPVDKIENVSIKKVPKSEDSFYGIIGIDNKLLEIYSLIGRISNSKTTILIRGESGTGKRLLAHSIHKADKKRRHKPFIEVSCGALPREIIESELFGHTKGAFTGAINDRKGRFELANGGTILLDDIDSLSLDLQVKLLRVIQQKEFERVGDHKTMKVDVRIIAASNQDLEKLVNDKRFREDLYYRLNVISICVPPLKERKEDLPSLIDHFINLHSKENHRKIKGVSEEIVSILTNYDWPGNIRELENIIERAVILDMDGIIDKKDLPELIINRAAMVQPETLGHIKKQTLNSLKDALKEPEKVYILRILKEVGWNKKKAARKLGINRTTLYNKLRKYNIFSNNDKE